MVYGIGYALSVLKVSLLSFAAPASNTYSLLAEIGSYALRVPEPWQPSVYPLLGTNDCGNASFAGNTSFAICDPDDVRNNRVVQFDIGISVVSDVFTTKANGNACTQRNESETNLDIAIAFLKSMDLKAMGSVDKPADRVQAAKDFAEHLYMQWGVARCFKTQDLGLLVFYSQDNLILHIAVGHQLAANDELLRLSMAAKMLSSKKSSEEIIKFLIAEIAGFARSGTSESTRFDWLTIYKWLKTAFLGISGYLVIWRLVDGRMELNRVRRGYPTIPRPLHSNMDLSESDKAHAWACQDKFKDECCPICREDFQDGSSSSRMGSDGMAIRILKCGHVFDETCFKDWVCDGVGHVHLCPICKKDVGFNIGRFCDRFVLYMNREQREEFRARFRETNSVSFYNAGNGVYNMIHFYGGHPFANVMTRTEGAVLTEGVEDRRRPEPLILLEDGSLNL